MASEAAVTNPNCEEVQKELKPEAKIMEPVQISPPKESVNCPEPEEVAVPVATSAESGAKVEETKIEPIATEIIKRIDTDENPETGDSVAMVEESEQKNESKQVVVPPGEDEKKIEDASNYSNSEVEKIPHPEPDVNSLSKESIVEKIEGELEEKLDRTVEEQKESKAETPVEKKLCEPEKVVEVTKQLPAKSAIREYVGDIEVLPNEEMEESEAELAKVEMSEEKKDELEKVINAGEQASIEAEPEDKLDTEIVEKQEEPKIEPSVEEKLCEPEKVVEVLKPLPDKGAARVFIGNIELLPDEEMEESEGDLAKVEKADEKKNELEKIINDGEQSSIKANPEEKLDTEIVEKQEGSGVEPSVEEKLGEPGKVVEVSKQLLANRAAREYIGNVEVLPDEEMEEPEVGLAKVEDIQDQKDEIEKIINSGEQSSSEAIKENVDKNPGEQVEAIEEKEVKGANSKPEEISETEPAENFEQSTVESVEEKLKEPSETVQMPVQLSLDPVEGKVENLEELPVKEVEASVEKKGSVSEAEPAEKQDEFKIEPVCEKVDEPTKTLPAKVEETEVKEADDPENEDKPKEISESTNVELVEKVSVEPVKIVDDLEQSLVKEKVEELPSKEAEPDVVKKVIIPDSKCKHEEILDAEPSQNSDESKDELPEKKLDEPKEIVEAVEEGDNCIKKVEELPTSIVEEIREAEDKEANVLEVESKPAEISETKPIESVEEKSVEPENIVDVPLQASVLRKPGEGGELPAKEIDIKDEEPEGISETKPAEKLEGSEVASVEAKPEIKMIADVQEKSSPEIDKDKIEVGVELPTKKVEAISEKENEVPEAEFKQDEISETEPAEKQDESKLQLVEESLSKPTKIVDVPEQSVKEVVEEKMGSKEELPAKEVDAPEEDTVKVSEYENKPDEINETKPVETIEEKLVEPKKIVDVAIVEKSEKVEELPVKEREEPVEIEAKILEAGFKPEEILASTPEKKLAEQSEVTGQHEKELPVAVPSEKEPKVLVSEVKPEEISKSTPEEKLIEQCEVTEQSEKEPPVAESVENEATNLETELKPEEIYESTPKEIQVKQSEIVEQSEKEAPASEPVEDLAEKVDKTELSNKEEQAILETRVEEVSAKTDAPNEQKESVKKSEDIDLLPEENSGKTELVTEPQEAKSVATREFTPCEEAKPTESETTENGNTKNEASVEGNRDGETTKEAEKCEPATQTENIGRSLKEKLDKEKRDDVTTKTDVQTEATNDSEDTKVPEDASKEEVPAKTTQKQSNNIMKMVKHSLVKAKKAITGKSANSKAPASEIKGNEFSK